jgi:general bacterial porin, GBP family
MKKTVLAVAALSLATGAAFAQSSLQLYGLVDLSVENVKVDGASGLTRVTNGNNASSRLGFKGTEDLGGGLKASFVLETAVLADTGAQGDTARFFDRSAWLGLSGGFGAVRIGRMDSLLGAMAGNTAVLGNQAFDDLKIAGMVGSTKWRRIDNTVTYALPDMVPGLKAEVQYSLGGTGTPNAETVNDDTNKQVGLSASYTSGPFAAGVSLLRAKINAAGDQKEGGTLGYASYDFGSFKLIGYHQADKQNTNPEKRKLTGVRVNVPVTSDLMLIASYAAVKNTSYAANGDDDDAKILTLESVYSLSKRTALYAMVTDVSNDPLSSLAVSTTGAAGKDARGIAFGVRHSF